MSRIEKGAILALLSSLFVFGGCVPDYINEANNTPAPLVYTRPDAPNVRIPVHAPAVGGMNSVQQSILIDLLNELPAADVGLVKTIGALSLNLPNDNVSQGETLPAGADYYPDGQEIVLDTALLQDPLNFARALLHEVGHAVQDSGGLSPAEVSEWIALHRASTQSQDFMTENAQIGTDDPAGSGDDFAETYMTWVSNTDAYGFQRAVRQAGLGDPVLLEKLLYTSALFANPNGTINFYSMFSNGPDSVPTFNVDQRPYSFSTDALTMGDYTYRLSQGSITSIEDLRGNVLAEGLSIPVPQILYDRLQISPHRERRALTLEHLFPISSRRWR